MAKASFGLIGYPVGHSVSPFLHGRLFALAGYDASYDVIPLAPDGFAKAMQGLHNSFRGCNVTIPHKQRVLPYLDELDEEAAFFGAVNVIRFGERAVGFNTDGYGFRKALARVGAEPSGRVLVLGCGGAGRTVALEAARAGATLTIAARGESGTELAREIEQRFGKAVAVCRPSEVHGAFDFVVNATPVGMFPDIEASLLTREQLTGSRALMDLVANPVKTRLARDASACGLTVARGVDMLVWQAARSHEIWYGATFGEADLAELADEVTLYTRMAFGDFKGKPLVLFGFMGCGKSTVGRRVAELVHRPFLDTDALVEERVRMSIADYVQKFGEAAFRQREREVCHEAAQTPNAIVSVGGGAMMQAETAQEWNGCAKIYIKSSFDVCRQRVGTGVGRPLWREDAAALFREREPLYAQAADWTVDGNKSIDEVAQRIAAIL